MGGKAEGKVVVIALVIIAVIAIVNILNIFGFSLPLSGFATTVSGTATINVTVTASIVLTDTNISFGNGYVSPTAPYAFITTTNSSPTNGTWAPVNDPFILENDGNVLANVTVKATSSAATWFGGYASYANMFFNYSNNESSSCLLAATGAALGAWGTIPQTPTVNCTCVKLNFSDPADTIRIDMMLQIPTDAPPGLKTNAITFTASQSA